MVVSDSRGDGSAIDCVGRDGLGDNRGAMEIQQSAIKILPENESHVSHSSSLHSLMTPSDSVSLFLADASRSNFPANM